MSEIESGKLTDADIQNFLRKAPSVKGIEINDNNNNNSNNNNNKK